MKKLLEYIKPHLCVMILQFVVKFGGTIIELLLPWMLSTILDDIVPSGNMKKVFIWGGLMLLCSVLALLGNVSQTGCPQRRQKDYRKAETRPVCEDFGPYQQADR
jgi:ATP-binding cassette subfamily B protein